MLTAELIARHGLGLGTPPLFVADPLIEYRLKPNQNLVRFGNRIEVNSASMRSATLTVSRASERRRVLVFGDSVVWGGANLDQALIATEKLKQAGIPEVGNVAAPSWGPGNWLGYVRRFGFQQATDVVLVISSHDAFDNPSPNPFRGDLSHPLVLPFSALAEGAERYLLPRLGFSRVSAHVPEASPASRAEPTSSADPAVEQGLADLRAFLQLARASGARVVVVQFADRDEARSGQLQLGNTWIKQLLQDQGIASLQSDSIFRSCGPIVSLYTDDIHPYTAAGQACLARAIEQALKLESPPAPSSR